MFKKDNTSKNSSKKSISVQEQGEKVEYLIEKVVRIDGVEAIKKYRKHQLLGKGGFANCFVTENVDTKRRAATKVIEKELLTSQKTKLRLLNEIRLHKTLHNENVVEFQHYFEDKQNVYIFLQLCSNQSLNELIKTRQYFTTPQIQSFMFGILNGLKYLHSKSIIHRDLKLGNVFLDDGFRIKLGDFGLATKLQFKEEHKRTICGTPNYIAPEILQGKGYHFGVDIWSVGVILYTLFYTIPPFETQEANTTYQKIKQCDYKIPRQMLVPPQANDLIRKILVKNPADRPTIEQILQSDFMRLGGKIYKQLPSICSRRAPTTKQFSNLPFWTEKDFLRNEKRNQQEKSKNTIELKQDIAFIVELDKLSQNQYFYQTNQGNMAIHTGQQIIMQDQSGFLKVLTLNSLKPYIQTCSQHPLKHFLSCRSKIRRSTKGSVKEINDRKERLMETTLEPLNSMPFYLSKVSDQSKLNFSMLKLSNHMIQLYFADGVHYLISGINDKFYEVRNGKINQNFKMTRQDILKKNKEQLSDNIEERKIKYIKGVICQVQEVKLKKNHNKARGQKENNQLHTSNKQNKDKNSTVTGKKESQQQNQPKPFQKINT